LKTLTLRTARLIMASWVAVALSLGCNGTGGSSRPGPTGRVTDVDPSDEGVLLRYSWTKDRLLRYDTNFRLNSQGDGRVDEKMRAVIYEHCLGAADDEPNPKFQKISLMRREIERNRTERSPEGQDLPPVNAVRTREPDVSLSPGYDSQANKYYFPINDRGMFGLRADRPFHRLVYDSIVYLLPVLPPARIRRGGTWSSEIPVYAGADYFYPAGGFRRGNEFNLRMDGRVERIYRQNDRTYAQLSWTCAGVFDSALAGDRYPAGFHNRQRIIHEVKGSGRGLFDLDAGTMVSKSGQATITFTARILITQRGRDDKPATHKWEESVDRHVIGFEQRLLADDEPDPRPKAR
jgi:hypothetical protein